MKSFKIIIIKITDFLCGPFYRYLYFFPFSIKVGKYPVYKQMQYLHFKLTRKYRTLPENIKLKLCNCQCNIEVIPGKDFHQMYLFMTGYYEKEVSNYILREMVSGEVFIDVGAYIGYYSVMVSCLHPDVQIYSFEPQKDAFENFQRNIQNNNCKNIKAYNCALADVDEMRLLNVNLFPEQTSLLPSTIQAGESYNVDVKRLDDLLDIKSKKVVVKIDTEGYEIEVMKGMSALIDKNDCIIYFEYNPQIYFQNFGKDYIVSFFEYIKLKGYKFFEIGTKEEAQEYFYNSQHSGPRNLAIKKTTGGCK